MSNVTKGTIGSGVLGPLQSVTWQTNVSAGGVWAFWLDNTTLGYNKASVRIAHVDTIRQGNFHRAEIRIFNSSNSVTTGFTLRWSFVYG